MKERKKFEQNGSMLVAVFFIVLVFGIVFFTWHFVHNRQLAKSASVSSVQKTSSSTSGQSGSSANGTDNNSLNSSLNSVNSSIGQENSDTSVSNAAINDQQSEVAVPTN